MLYFDFSRIERGFGKSYRFTSPFVVLRLTFIFKVFFLANFLESLQRRMSCVTLLNCPIWTQGRSFSIKYAQYVWLSDDSFFIKYIRTDLRIPSKIYSRIRTAFSWNKVAS